MPSSPWAPVLGGIGFLALLLFATAALVEGLWMIPAFFVFVRLGVLSKVTMQELHRAAPEAKSLLLLGFACGTTIVLAACLGAIAGLRVLHQYVVTLSDTADALLDACWYAFSAIVMTFLAVALIRLVALRDSLRRRVIAAVAAMPTGDARERRERLFYESIKFALRDGLRSSLFYVMLGWRDALAIPLPAGVGFLVGMFCAGWLVRLAVAVPLQAFSSAGDAAAKDVTILGGGGGGAATAAVEGAAVAAGGVISAEVEARTLSASWGVQRTRIFDSLTSEHQEAVDMAIRTASGHTLPRLYDSNPSSCDWGNSYCDEDCESAYGGGYSSSDGGAGHGSQRRTGSGSRRAPISTTAAVEFGEGPATQAPKPPGGANAVTSVVPATADAAAAVEGRTHVRTSSAGVPPLPQILEEQEDKDTLEDKETLASWYVIMAGGAQRSAARAAAAALVVEAAAETAAPAVKAGDTAAAAAAAVAAVAAATEAKALATAAWEEGGDSGYVADADGGSGGGGGGGLTTPYSARSGAGAGGGGAYTPSLAASFFQSSQGCRTVGGGGRGASRATSQVAWEEQEDEDGGLSNGDGDGFGDEDDGRGGGGGGGGEPLALTAAAVSALTLMLIAAGMAGAGAMRLQDAGAIASDTAVDTLWNACTADADGAGDGPLDAFVRVLQEQFYYECSPTLLYIYAWCGYWSIALFIVSFCLRLCCWARVPGGGLNGRVRTAAAAGPIRRGSTLRLGGAAA
ncbi:unnamed protein product, partial [Phaeothamnion confervicola]